MATWRGKETTGELFLDFNSVSLILYSWQMSFWIFSTVTRRAEESRRSFRASLARSKIDRLPFERGEGDDPAEISFQLPDVGLDLVGDEQGDAFRKDEPFDFRLLFEDGDPRFDIRRLDIGDQAPFETGTEPLFHALDFPRRTIGGDDDLFLVVVEMVERVKKFFLGPVLPGQVVDIVHQQDVDRTGIFPGNRGFFRIEDD